MGVNKPNYFVLGFAYFEDCNIPFENFFYSDLCSRYPLTTSIDFAKRYKSVGGCKRAINSKSLQDSLTFLDFDRFIIIPCYD